MITTAISPTSSGRASPLLASLAVGGLLLALIALICSPLVWLFDHMIPGLAGLPGDRLIHLYVLEPLRFHLYFIKTNFSFWLKILTAALLACALLLGSASIGLWQRRAWTRPCFIALLWLIALGNLLLLAAGKQYLRLFFRDLQRELQLHYELDVASQLLAALTPGFFWLLLATALATLALHAWSAWRAGRYPRRVRRPHGAGHGQLTHLCWLAAV
jgi:hypothetical protein